MFFVVILSGCSTGDATTYNNVEETLKTTQKNTHKSFALVYVDDDDIPEIYLHGIDESTGDSIGTYKNGALIEQPLHRTGGGWYVEKCGKVININGHMGQTYTHVYELSEDGFKLIFEALSSEHINDEKELYFEYSIGDMSVSESEYALAVKDAVELEDAVRFNDVEVDYDTIRQQIINQFIHRMNTTAVHIKNNVIAVIFILMYHLKFLRMKGQDHSKTPVLTHIFRSHNKGSVLKRCPLIFQPILFCLFTALVTNSARCLTC